MEDESSTAIPQIQQEVNTDDLPQEDENQPDLEEQAPETNDDSELQKHTTEIFELIQQSANNEDPNAILELDLNYFCEEALNESQAENQRRAINTVKALLHVYAYNNSDLATEEVPSDTKKCKNAQKEGGDSSARISESYLAGICLLDLANNRMWRQRVFSKSKNGQLISAICKKSLELQFDDYGCRNLQARIQARFLLCAYTHHRDLMADLIEELTENVSDGEYNQVDASLRTLIYLIEKIEDVDAVKEFHEYLPPILSSILSAFTNEEIGSHGREQVLHILYLCLRCISWADGIDNELIDDCLNDTFNQWMAVFLQVIQSDSKKFFDIKRNALKCLTVIFRDFINYSRECINMILRPAWKLMNMHLPIFTEVLGYNNDINQLKELIGAAGAGDGEGDDEGQDDGEDEDEEEAMADMERRGFESDEDDEIEEPHGIKGMTLQLIELLTTLVQRPNVQEVVRQGINPLLMTVSSYMIVEYKDQKEHRIDENYFLYDKTQTVFKTRNIKNQCVDLFSSLIEIFGDQAISSIILVINSLLDIKQDEPLEQEERKESADSQKSTVESEINQDFSKFSYTSANKNHVWKRKDVAMILLGIFIEDVQMYCMRNPKFKLTSLIGEIVSIDFLASGAMKSYLRGRTLWCASTCSESLIFPDQKTTDLKSFILDMAIGSLKSSNINSIKLVSTRTLVKYARKIKKENLQENAPKFESILDNLLELLDFSNKEVMHLPIEAFQTFSKVNQETVSKMAPKITPKLLKIFKAEHSEGSLGQELINLFKQWCQYDDCRDIFINTFIPFIMEIIESYYNSTPNEDNKDTILQLCSVSESLSLDSSNEKLRPTQEQKVLSVVDSTILQHVLDLLCTLLKKTDKEKHPEEFQKIVSIFPQLLNFVYKSEDMFLLLHGTAALKNFIFLGHKEILKICEAEQIIELAKRLLSPQTNEQAAMCLGNLVIQIFHKIQPKIDTSVLFCVVQKIYKTRMPSTLQSLMLVFARLIQTNPVEIVELLSDTSVDNRISLKVVLDKWLLQQPLFRGPYTKIVTLTALQKLFMMRDSRIESLMVIGYNPSHSNINSEVNAPFKILSTLLRFLENESQLTGKKRTGNAPNMGDPYGEELEFGSGSPRGAFGGYSMQRNNGEIKMSGNERLDTMEGQYDLYDDEDDDDFQNESFDEGDRQEVEDGSSSGSGVNSDGGKKRAKKKLDTSQEKIEVNLDDIEDDDDQECLLDYKQSDLNKLSKNKIEPVKQKSNDSTQSDDKNSMGDFDTNSLDGNLFKIKESNDKGLADMETGSEVYMSELLAGFDMEDFDEADEQNEEDLMLLGDDFANIADLKSHILENFKEFIQDEEKHQKGKEYIQYCVKQLHDDDQLLAKQYLMPLFQQKEGSPKKSSPSKRKVSEEGKKVLEY